MKIFKMTSVVVCLAFLANSVLPSYSFAQDFQLPAPGEMVPLSPQYDLPVLKGIKVHRDNPFRFDFILDKGDSAIGNDALKEESNKLIKYFLASLTVPEDNLWVNLSPYEKDRIVPQSFGLTTMGRDLLAEDYILKQVTSSLINPESAIGKKFWTRVYEESAKRFGTTNIPVSTFNKVWIVPQKVVVYENADAGTAYVVESHLKVMLEQDYLALSKNQGQPGDMFKSELLRTCPQAGCQAINPLSTKAPQVNNRSTNELGNQIVREIVIPELNREVNQGRNFAQLRQVYNSLILATWYKKKIKDSILSQVYADKNKVAGVNIDDPKEKERIYQQYVEAFKKGVYNYVKDEIDPLTLQNIPRKYFSGGMELEPSKAMIVTHAIRKISDLFKKGLYYVAAAITLPVLASNLASAQTPEYQLMAAVGQEQFLPAISATDLQTLKSVSGEWRNPAFSRFIKIDDKHFRIAEPTIGNKIYTDKEWGSDGTVTIESPKLLENAKPFSLDLTQYIHHPFSAQVNGRQVFLLTDTYTGIQFFGLQEPNNQQPTELYEIRSQQVFHYSNGSWVRQLGDEANATIKRFNEILSKSPKSSGDVPPNPNNFQVTPIGHKMVALRDSHTGIIYSGAFVPNGALPSIFVSQFGSKFRISSPENIIPKITAQNPISVTAPIVVSTTKNGLTEWTITAPDGQVFKGVAASSWTLNGSAPNYYGVPTFFYSNGIAYSMSGPNPGLSVTLPGVVAGKDYTLIFTPLGTNDPQGAFSFTAATPQPLPGKPNSFELYDSSNNAGFTGQLTPSGTILGAIVKQKNSNELFQVTGYVGSLDEGAPVVTLTPITTKPIVHPNGGEQEGTLVTLTRLGSLNDGGNLFYKDNNGVEYVAAYTNDPIPLVVQEWSPNSGTFGNLGAYYQVIVRDNKTYLVPLSGSNEIASVSEYYRNGQYGYTLTIAGVDVYSGPGIPDRITVDGKNLALIWVEGGADTEQPITAASFIPVNSQSNGGRGWLQGSSVTLTEVSSTYNPSNHEEINTFQDQLGNKYVAVATDSNQPLVVQSVASGQYYEVKTGKNGATHLKLLSGSSFTIPLTAYNPSGVYTLTLPSGVVLTGKAPIANSYLPPSSFKGSDGNIYAVVSLTINGLTGEPTTIGLIEVPSRQSIAVTLTSASIQMATVNGVGEWVIHGNGETLKGVSNFTNIPPTVFIDSKGKAYTATITGLQPGAVPNPNSTYQVTFTLVTGTAITTGTTVVTLSVYGLPAGENAAGQAIRMFTGPNGTVFVGEEQTGGFVREIGTNNIYTIVQEGNQFASGIQVLEMQLVANPTAQQIAATGYSELLQELSGRGNGGRQAGTQVTLTNLGDGYSEGEYNVFKGSDGKLYMAPVAAGNAPQVVQAFSYQTGATGGTDYQVINEGGKTYLKELNNASAKVASISRSYSNGQWTTSVLIGGQVVYSGSTIPTEITYNGKVLVLASVYGQSSETPINGATYIPIKNVNGIRSVWDKGSPIVYPSGSFTFSSFPQSVVKTINGKEVVRWQIYDPTLNVTFSGKSASVATPPTFVRGPNHTVEKVISIVGGSAGGGVGVTLSPLGVSTPISGRFDHREHRDRAMLTRGGIDFNTARLNLELKNAGREIVFRVDPAMLAQLKNAPGFTSKVIGIYEMTELSLKQFLGVQ